MTPRPFKILGGFATALVALGTMAPAMANPQQRQQHHASICRQMVQSGSVAFPRVAVGCGMNPNGPRGYVNASNLYRFIQNGGRIIVISESQEVSPNQWRPHSIRINGQQAYDNKGNNVLILR